MKAENSEKGKKVTKCFCIQRTPLLIYTDRLSLSIYILFVERGINLSISLRKKGEIRAKGRRKNVEIRTWVKERQRNVEKGEEASIRRTATDPS